MIASCSFKIVRKQIGSHISIEKSDSYEVSYDIYDVVIVFYLLISGMNLFWIDAYHGVIGRINIDTGVRKILSSEPNSYFLGMTLVGDKLYITDWYRK
jgi:hypothetical protein